MTDEELGMQTTLGDSIWRRTNVQNLSFLNVSTVAQLPSINSRDIKLKYYAVVQEWFENC